MSRSRRGGGRTELSRAARRAGRRGAERGRRPAGAPGARTALLTGGLAAVAARAAYAALNSRPPGGRAVWTRTNHRGEPVTLLEGPAAAAAAVTAAALAPGLSARGRGALAAAGAGAAAFGCYDDLAGSGDRRGFRGHLGALAGGELTSGAVKIGGIGATGVAASLLVGGPAPDLVINAGLVAGGANLLNLFDLRPGRAIKVTLAAGALIAAGPAGGGPAVAAPLGAAVALLPEDLGERAMLGDAGANALGAMLGTAAAIALPRAARVAVLAVVAGLTAASEVVSFTKVIERTPPLRWLDMLGRAPAGRWPPPGRQAPAGQSGGAGPRPRRPASWRACRPGRIAGSGGTAGARLAGVGGRRRPVTGPAAPVTRRGPEEPGRHGAPGRRAIGRAALLIGALTAAARLVGFGRQLVFAHTVGASCLGTAYTTANQVPNIIYDIVLGGALTSVMVPVLAGPAQRAAAGSDGAAEASRIASALLTWTIAILVPVSVLLAAVAGPIVSLLVPGRAGLRARRGGDGGHPDAGGLRAADPALRPGRGAVRDAAGTPQVRGAGPGAGAVQPGRHRRLRGLRAARPGAHPAAVRPVRRGAADALGRHHGRRRGAGPHGAAARAAAAAAAAAGAAVPGRRGAAGPAGSRRSASPR